MVEDGVDFRGKADKEVMINGRSRMGHSANPSPSSSPSTEMRLEMLRRMLMIRNFEETVAELMRTGEMVGSTHLTIGQEGAVVGACLALAGDDYMVGTHRSHGHLLAKGAAPAPLLAELLGRRTGVNKGKGGSMHLAEFAIGSLGETGIVGSGLPIGVGAALSAQMRGSNQAVLVFFGDGATNEGTFHESLNLASLWRLPVVFFCENNGYAVTTRIEDASAVGSVAERASAYAIASHVCDGQEPIACWQSVSEALGLARTGLGPSLIEAITYRFADHAEGRSVTPHTAEEMESWQARDPIKLFITRLVDEGNEQAVLDSIANEAGRLIADALKAARSGPYPEPGEEFDDLFAEPADRA